MTRLKQIREDLKRVRRNRKRDSIRLEAAWTDYEANRAKERHLLERIAAAEWRGKIGKPVSINVGLPGGWWGDLAGCVGVLREIRGTRALVDFGPEVALRYGFKTGIVAVSVLDLRQPNETIVQEGRGG